MENFENRTIAITGSTGGLGRQICFSLANGGANLLLVDRNIKKSQALAEDIKQEYPDTKIDFVTIDLSNMQSVMDAAKELSNKKFDSLVLNAGIFNVPLKKLDSGYNNIFQINFVAQYKLLTELLKENKSGIKKVVAMGSIAHKWAKYKEDDIDYSNEKNANKIYGNAKKFLIYSLFDLAKKHPEVDFCPAHPGITLTSMTGHYPKWINWLVVAGMKLLFPSPKKACRSVICALNERCDFMQWVGPHILNVYGKPKRRKLKYKQEEYDKIVTEIQKRF